MSDTDYPDEDWPILTTDDLAAIDALSPQLPKRSDAGRPDHAPIPAHIGLQLEDTPVGIATNSASPSGPVGKYTGLDKPPPKWASPYSLHKKGRLQRFSVTELVGPSWCEYQFEYGLRQGRSERLAQRPGKFVTSKGKEIVVKKETAAVNDKVLKRGRAVHKKLELEVHPEQVPLTPSSQEERWAVKLLNMITGVESLLNFGCCREMPVFGLLHGEVVIGIIDELTLLPVPEQPSSPSKSKGKGKALPADQTNLAAFFPTSPTKRKSRETPTHTLHLSDSKTRMHPSLPSSDDAAASRFQLMIYHRLLGALLAQALDFEHFWERLAIRPGHAFGGAFVRQIRPLLGGWALEALESDGADRGGVGRDGGETTPTMTLREIGALWAVSVSTLAEKVERVEREMTLVYRLRGEGQKARKKAKWAGRSGRSGSGSMRGAEGGWRAAGGDVPKELHQECERRAVSGGVGPSMGAGPSEGPNVVNADLERHPDTSPAASSIILTKEDELLLQAIEASVADAPQPLPLSPPYAPPSPPLGQPDPGAAGSALGLTNTDLAQVSSADAIIDGAHASRADVDLALDQSAEVAELIRSGEDPGADADESGSEGDGEAASYPGPSVHVSPSKSRKTAATTSMMTLPSDANIIGKTHFEMDDGLLDAYLADILEWWHGKRASRGVDASQTRRCHSCEYSDGCEWREKKSNEFAAANRGKTNAEVAAEHERALLEIARATADQPRNNLSPAADIPVEVEDTPEVDDSDILFVPPFTTALMMSEGASLDHDIDRTVREGVNISDVRSYSPDEFDALLDSPWSTSVEEGLVTLEQASRNHIYKDNDDDFVVLEGDSEGRAKETGT